MKVNRLNDETRRVAMYSSLNVGEKTWIIIALNANETAFLIGVTTVTGLALFPISKEDGVTHMFWLRLSHKNTSNNVTQVMRVLTTHALVCTPHHTRTVLYLYLYYSTVVHVYCTVVQYVGGTVCNWLSRMLFAVISEKDGSCGSIDIYSSTVPYFIPSLTEQVHEEAALQVTLSNSTENFFFPQTTLPLSATMMSPASDVKGMEAGQSTPTSESQPMSSLEVEQPLPSVAELTGRTQGEEPSNRRRSDILVPILLILVVVLLSLSIGLGLGLKEAEDSNAKEIDDQKQQETVEAVVDLQKRYNEIVRFLSESEVSHLADLESDGSPQKLAATFMAFLDPLLLEIPHSHVVRDGYTFVTRYILMVLFFSTNGDEWTNLRNFRSKLPTCQWWEVNLDESTSHLYKYTGVICNERGIITNLLLRTSTSDSHHHRSLSASDLMSFSLFRSRLEIEGFASNGTGITVLAQINSIKQEQALGKHPREL